MSNMTLCNIPKMIKMLVNQKASIFNHAVSRSSPRAKKLTLTSTEQVPQKAEMLAVSWWATSPCWVEWKYLKSQSKNNKNCPCIYSQHISILTGTKNSPEWEHIPVLYHPTRAVCQALLFIVQTTHLQSQTAFVLSSDAPVFFNQQLWTLPFTSRCLRNRTFLPWAWWSHCLPP